MPGAKTVYVGQHGANALCFWSKLIPSQQRVQPDQPPGRQMQPLHCFAQNLRIIAIQPIGDQQYHGTLPHANHRQGGAAGRWRRRKDWDGLQWVEEEGEDWENLQVRPVAELVHYGIHRLRHDLKERNSLIFDGVRKKGRAEFTELSMSALGERSLS